MVYHLDSKGNIKKAYDFHSKVTTFAMRKQFEVIVPLVEENKIAVIDLRKVDNSISFHEFKFYFDKEFEGCY